MKTRRPYDPKTAAETNLEVDKSARVLSAEVPLEAELVYVAGLAVVLYLVGLFADLHFLRLVAKPWPVVSLARWALTRARDDQRPELRTVAYALFSGAAGDLLLELGEGTFLFGVVAFLAGHVFYVQALHLQTDGMRWPHALLPLAFVASMIALLAPALPEQLIAPIVIYALAVGAVLFRAAARAATPGLVPMWARLGLLGAALFAVSDAVLAIDRFHTPILGARYLVIATYWAAQSLLAVSLVRGSAVAPVALVLPTPYAKQPAAMPPAPAEPHAGDAGAPNDERSDAAVAAPGAAAPEDGSTSEGATAPTAVPPDEPTR